MAAQGGGCGPLGFAVVDLALDRAAGVAVRGEVELAIAPELTTALDEAIRRTGGLFVVDLSAVGFLDSSGISCLVRARALLGADDRTMALICPPGSARRALELTGLDELIAIYDSREQLVRELQ
jgi:anti-sigma B factor antagonist